MFERFVPPFATGLKSPVVFCVGMLLLAFAPLIRGGNRHVALVFLESLALLLLLVLSVPSGGREAAGSGKPAGEVWGVPKTILFLALAPLWVGIVQLTPLPPHLWGMLPGREVYVQMLSVVQVPVNAWRPLSLMPDATWISVLAGLPPAAAFLWAYVASQHQLVLILRAVALFSFAQAILGLLQFSLFKGLYFDAVATGRAIGSFANPNHFANYIAMTLPLTILAFRQAMLAGSIRVERGRGSLGAGRSMIPAFWGAVLFIQLAALLASLSRAGLGVGVFGAFAAVLLLPLRQLSHRARMWRVAGVSALCILVASTVGVDGLVARVAGSVLEDGRWLLIQGTWQGVLAFWPFGSGLGSYAGVFPQFQPAGLSGFADYAHSDFLQLLMECGAIFVVLMGVALMLVVKRVMAVSRRLVADPADPVAVLQASCGLGLLVVLLHSSVDFNLRIPANAISAALLFGAFLRFLPTMIARQQSKKRSLA